MPIRLHNIRAGLNAVQSDLERLAAEKLGIDANSIANVRLARRAIDSRHRKPVFVCTIDVTLRPGQDEVAVAERTASALVAGHEEPRLEFKPGSEPFHGRPIVVGAGPAGLFAAYMLARAGFRPLVIERGQPVEQRAKDIDTFLTTARLDPESNILFGLGGAGTWSDGKLTAAASDPLGAFILDTLVRCGAPEQILVDARPHIGTDLLRIVTERFARLIESAGGEFVFGRRVASILIRDGQAAGVRFGDEQVEAGAVLLGIGHSARDTLRTLADQGVAIAARPFQVGVRIEHPQQMIDHSQYGDFAGHPQLPAADYSLQHTAHGGWRSVHSFCMCPGGVIVPAMNEDGEICTNGMSTSARDGEFANTALVVPVGPKDFGDGRFDGMAFQERIERAAFAATGSFSAPAQRADDFVKDRIGSVPARSSYPLGVVPAQFSRILPHAVCGSIARALAMTFERVIRGFASERGTVLGPETRVSSSVRLVRDERTRQSVSTPGLYPIGEGSGYAGGIISSAIDGIVTARAIIERHRPHTA